METLVLSAAAVSAVAALVSAACAALTVSRARTFKRSLDRAEAWSGYNVPAQYDC